MKAGLSVSFAAVVGGDGLLVFRFFTQRQIGFDDLPILRVECAEQRAVLLSGGSEPLRQLLKISITAQQSIDLLHSGF